jgi:RNA polymerase sigma-70 factor (ECF subfamily)
MQTNRPEQDLVKRSQRGDEDAFLELYLLYRDKIYRFAYRMLGECLGAEDVTQDCFLVLVRQLDRYDPARAALGTYLYAVTRNLCHKRLRDTVQETAYEDTTEVTQDDSGPLGELLVTELSSQVAAAVANLPNLQREVVVLFEFEGLSLSEIAVIASTDVGSVKSRLYRARQRLRKALNPYLRDSIRLAPEK